MTKVIDSFSKEKFFLSNFYAAPMWHGDILMPTVEHAFQATKTKKESEKHEISLAGTPAYAKKLGQDVTLRKDWDNIKVKVMLKLVRKKFEIPALRKALLLTGNAKLIEGNYWKDDFWGVYKGEGKNWLGKILMKVRKEIQEEENE